MHSCFTCRVGAHLSGLRCLSTETFTECPHFVISAGFIILLATTDTCCDHTEFSKCTYVDYAVGFLFALAILAMSVWHSTIPLYFRFAHPALPCAPIRHFFRLRLPTPRLFKERGPRADVLLGRLASRRRRGRRHARPAAPGACHPRLVVQNGFI